MMETQPHFFSDSINLEDPHAFLPATLFFSHDDGFHAFGNRAGGSPTPTWSRYYEAKAQSTSLEPLKAPIPLYDDAEARPLFGDAIFEDEDDVAEDEDGSSKLAASLSSSASSRRTSNGKIRKSAISRRTSTPNLGSTPTNFTFPDLNPPGKRRKTLNTGKTSKKETGMADDSDRRNKFLERNRIAASKCREKKKAYVSQLEENKAHLEAHNQQLHMEMTGLINEVGALKHQLMAHAKCNDGNIDHWLGNEARRFVQHSNDVAAFHQVSLAGGYVPPPPSIPSSHSRNPSTASTLGGGFDTFDRAEESSFSIDEYDGFGSGRADLHLQHHKHSSQQGYSPAMTSHQESSLQTSPTDATFSALTSPHIKTEQNINYDHMPDHLLAPDLLAFIGSGG